jgi:MFS-type transporter involved in bile tolerance (Atg22 family)
MVGTTAMVGVPFLTTNWLAVGAAVFFAGFGSSVWSINSRTIVQRTVPPDMLGRFYAIYRMLSWGCLPAGAMLAGVAAESVDLRLVFAAVAALSVAQAVVFWKKFQPA